MKRRRKNVVLLVQVVLTTLVLLIFTNNLPAMPRMKSFWKRRTMMSMSLAVHSELESYEKILEDVIENYHFKTVGDIKRYQWMQGDPNTRVSLLELARRKYVINCSNVEEIQIGKLLGYGKYKSTYDGTFRGIKVAVKVITRRLVDSSLCTDKILNSMHTGDLMHLKNSMLFAHCSHNSPVDSMIYEILNHAILDYPNIVRNLGYCIRDFDVNTADSGILTQPLISVFEYGDPVCMSSLTNLPFIERVKHCRDIANLLDLSEHSVLGSIGYTDMHTRHFVMANNKLKLVDLDSYVTPVETKCGPKLQIPVHEKRKKRKKFRYRENCTHITGISTPCMGGVCRGLNAKANIYYFTKIFFARMMDKHTLPAREYEKIKLFVESMDELRLTAAQLRTAFDRILIKFGDGANEVVSDNNTSNVIEQNEGNDIGTHDNGVGSQNIGDVVKPNEGNTIEIQQQRYHGVGGKNSGDVIEVNEGMVIKNQEQSGRGTGRQSTSDVSEQDTIPVKENTINVMESNIRTSVTEQSRSTSYAIEQKRTNTIEQKVASGQKTSDIQENTENILEQKGERKQSNAKEIKKPVGQNPS